MNHTKALKKQLNLKPEEPTDPVYKRIKNEIRAIERAAHELAVEPDDDNLQLEYDRTPTGDFVNGNYKGERSQSYQYD